MQVDELPSIDPNVDYTQILPIQQKRTVAFINHFIMNTVECLNNFAQSCESRLMEFHYKLEKIEASLLIIESQLASIPGLDQSNDDSNKIINYVRPERESTPIEDLPEIKKLGTEEIVEEVTVDSKDTTIAKTEGIKACDDSRFQKYFKMVQVGVPLPAVKLKMQNEGLDPNVLDNPNAVIDADIPNLTSTS